MNQNQHMYDDERRGFMAALAAEIDQLAYERGCKTFELCLTPGAEPFAFCLVMDAATFAVCQRLLLAHLGSAGGN